MYYTTKDVARILGISDSAVKYNSQQGRLNFSSKRGGTKLYSKEDIIAFADEYNYKIDDEFAFYTREELIQLIYKLKSIVKQLIPLVLRFF